MIQVYDFQIKDVDDTWCLCGIEYIGVVFVSDGQIGDQFQQGKTTITERLDETEA